MLKIALVDYPGHLLTSRDAQGRSRHPNGRYYTDTEVATVATSSTPGRWRGHVLAVQAFVGLNEAWEDDGGSPLRWTDGLRSNQRQAELRRAFDMWVRAGRPKQGTPGWRPGMRSDLASPPNESNHGWGAACDLAVGLLAHQRYPKGSDATLGRLWEVMRRVKVAKEWTSRLGAFRPIIRDPMVGQSESWHFDVFGPLLFVRQRATAEGDHGVYGLTAEIGCLLAGTYAGGNLLPRHYQARLALASALEGDGASWPGRADGSIGPRTRASARSLDLEGVSFTEAIETLDAGILRPFWEIMAPETCATSIA